ncbi:MAG: biotin/lipoate A/B protein ligase family protein [Thermodesulfobacteriota bacterium]
MEEWRLIVDSPAEGSENMAVDEAILLSCEMGIAPSTIRFYEWRTPTISIGYLQSYTSFDGVEAPVIRRISGGRAVIHDAELTYSIICRREDSLFSKGIHGSYEVISRAIINALKDLSIEATIVPSKKRSSEGVIRESCFSSPSRYEIIVDGKKVAGSAQRRFKRAFLQHGSIIFDVDREMIVGVFGESALDSMTWLNLFKKVGKDEFRTACIERIEEALGVRLYHGTLSEEEECLRDRLILEKYTSDRWNKAGMPA